MSFKSILTTALTILSITALTQAQNDTEEIKKIIHDLSKDVETLYSEGSNRAEQIMQYTNPNFFYDQRSVNIMNVVKRETFNRDKLSFMLHELRASDVKAKRVVEPVKEIYVRGNMALARYKINYELFEGDRLINKGVQFNEVIFRKNSSNKWLIESINTLSVDDITFKSMCICEIYETQGLGKIMTETIVPDGHEADILEDKFSIDETTQPRLVRHGFRDYWWELEGAIFNRKADGTKGSQIGVAKSRQELILTLLKKEVYPDRCNNVIRKLR